MIVHLHIIGTLFILLALSHTGFPRYFKWAQQLASLSLLDRQMMHVHTFFIALVVFLFGLLCLTSAQELMTTALGRRICLGLGIFWGARALVQWFYYSPALWRGKRLETTVHIVFSVFWVYCTAIFLWCTIDGR